MNRLSQSQIKPSPNLTVGLERPKFKIEKICSSCGGLGYTNHQKIYEDGYDLEKEQNCLICHGLGKVEING